MYDENPVRKERDYFAAGSQTSFFSLRPYQGYKHSDACVELFHYSGKANHFTGIYLGGVVKTYSL